MFTAILSLLAVLSVAPTAEARPSPLDPSFGFVADDYPFEAVRGKLEGVVAFRLHVDEAGAPIACTVTGSSGHSVLDTQTCALLMLRARFRPATGSDGKPVASEYASRVKWQLPAQERTEIYRATTFTLPIDPQSPRCEAEWSYLGNMPMQSCEMVAGRHAGLFAELAPTHRSATVLIAFSGGGKAPAPYKARWGELKSRVVIEQMFRADWPENCRTIIAEGAGAGEDGCAGFNDAKRSAGPPPPDAQPNTSFVDVSVFAAPR